MDDEDEDGGLTDPSEARVFDSVVSNLRKTYPKDKMQDISTSFCFICLLHLANERGLKVEVGDSPEAEDEDQPEEGDNKVGDLWGLRVSLFSVSLSFWNSLFLLRSIEIQMLLPRREGAAGEYRQSILKSAYVLMAHLHVFYRFVGFLILT